MREEEKREKNSLLATEISVARERERDAQEEYEEEERVREEEKREKNSLLATEISVARERERERRAGRIRGRGESERRREFFSLLSLTLSFSSWCG